MRADILIGIAVGFINALPGSKSFMATPLALEIADRRFSGLVIEISSASLFGSYQIKRLPKTTSLTGYRRHPPRHQQCLKQ